MSGWVGWVHVMYMRDRARRGFGSWPGKCSYCQAFAAALQRTGMAIARLARQGGER